MIWTNKFNLQQRVINVITGKRKDKAPDIKRMSVTDLIDEPLPRYLYITEWDKITRDYSDFLTMVQGTALHDRYEKMSLDEDDAEHKFEDEVGGYTLVGMADNYVDETIIDIKQTCLPLSAKALTRKGFKFVSDLILGEDIAAYDIKSDNIKWTPLQYINCYKDGETISIKGKTFNIRCTSNHKWVTQNRMVNGGYTRSPANLKEIVNIKTHERIIVSAPCREQEIISISPTEAYLIGWLFSDGCYKPENSSAVIYQSVKSPAYNNIKEKLKNYISSKYIKHYTNKLWTSGATFTLKFPIVHSLMNRAGVKNSFDLPTFLCNISFEAREKFIQAMHEADGHKETMAFGKTKLEIVEA